MPSRQRRARYALISSIGLAAAVSLGAIVSWAPIALETLGSADVPGVVAGTDFRMFYGAAELAADDAWSELYSLEGFASALDAAEGGVSFAYPPPLAQLLIPLTWLPYPSALGVWMGLALTAVILIPGVFGRNGAFALAALSFPLYIMLRFGQFGTVTLISLTASAAALRSGRERLAGAAIGWLLLKPQLLVGALVVGAGDRRFRREVALWMGAVAVGITAVSVVFDPRAWFEWVTGFADVSTPAVFTRWDFSFRAVAEPLGSAGSAALQASVAVGILALGVVIARRLANPAEVVAVGLIVSALISPRMVAYDWVLLIPSFAWLGDRIWNDTRLLLASTAVALGSLSGFADLGWAAWTALAVFLAALWSETRPRAELSGSAAH